MEKSPFQPHVSRHFSEIKAIWLAFDSLTYFTTFEKIYLKMGSGGWLHKGKVLAPLMFVVLYENLSALFAFCAIIYLFFRRKKSSDWKRPIIYIFSWFGRTRSFAYVPVRDQNLVVRGKNYRLFGFVFFISFEKKV